MAMTPDQERNIDSLVEKFEKDWFVDPKTKEIRRNPISLPKYFLYFLYRPRHSVLALYWYAKKRWSQFQLLSFHFPIEHDNMPIKGFPIKYRMMGGWTIPTADLKYLYKGPLASEDLNKIFVPADIGWVRFWKYGVIIVKLLIIPALVLISTIIRYQNEIKAMLKFFG